MIKDKQHKELEDLKQNFLDISPINSVPKIIHKTVEHPISEEIEYSDNESSSSSSDFSNFTDNELTKELKKLLK